MIAIVLLIILLLGGLLSLCIKPDLKPLELIGISFPMGFGIWSILLWLLDIAGMAINNRITLLISCLFLITILLVLVWKQKDKMVISRDSFVLINGRQIKNFIQNPYTINPLYILLLGLVCFIIFILVSKTLYWPIFNYDSINGYDLIAKLIGSEGHYNNTVFSPENPMHTLRSFYPPLLVHALSISYIFGAGHSKITAVLFLISTVLTLYALVEKRHTHLLAIVAVFLLCIIPEFMGQSALTASNPVAACYLLISLGFFDQYMKSKNRKTFFLSLIALSFTIWTRTEAVIFAVPLFLLLFNKSQIKNSFRDMALLSGFTLIPFVSWQLFIKTLSTLPASQPVIKNLFFDADRLSDLLSQVKIIILHTEFYALGLFLIFFCLLTNLIFFKKAKDTLSLSFILITSFVLYIWVYYQVDTEFKILHQGSWIGSGFKRGLFYFLPIGCYYVSCSFLIQKLFRIKVENNIDDTTLSNSSQIR